MLQERLLWLGGSGEAAGWWGNQKWVPREITENMEEPCLTK